MAQAEKTLQNRILTYLNFFDDQSFAYEVYNGGVVARAFGNKIIYKTKGKFRPNGMVDIIWLYKGKTTYVETKTKQGVLSKEQKLIHAKIVKCGGEVIVIRDFKEMTDYADKLRNGKV